MGVVEPACFKAYQHNGVMLTWVHHLPWLRAPPASSSLVRLRKPQPLDQGIRTLGAAVAGCGSVLQLERPRVSVDATVRDVTRDHSIDTNK